MFVPSRLTAARKRRGVTITALSVDSDTSTKSISDYENGKKGPSVKTIIRLARALEVPPEYFSRLPLEEVPEERGQFPRAKQDAQAQQGHSSHNGEPCN